MERKGPEITWSSRRVAQLSQMPAEPPEDSGSDYNLLRKSKTSRRTAQFSPVGTQPGKITQKFL